LLSDVFQLIRAVFMWSGFFGFFPLSLLQYKIFESPSFIFSTFLKNTLVIVLSHTSSHSFSSTKTSPLPAKMQTTTLLSLGLFAISAWAIEITSPTKNSEVDLSAGVTVTWSTVSTDPKSAHLFLVNMAGGHTPFTKDLGEVDLSRGSITVKGLDAPSDESYQFNFQSIDSHNTGILAQSAQFEVKKADKPAETTKSTSSTGTAKATKTSSSDDVLLVSETAKAQQSTLSSVIASASGLVASASASGAASKTSSGSAANASETGAASAMNVSGVLALVAGVVAVVA